jgi:hypothetical protein
MSVLAWTALWWSKTPISLSVNDFAIISSGSFASMAVLPAAEED